MYMDRSRLALASCALVALLTISCVNSQKTSDPTTLKFKQWWWINREIVVIMATDTSLYRSHNGGSIIFPLNITGVTDVVQDQVEPQKFYFNADPPMRSLDGGLSPTIVSNWIRRTNFQPHPTISGHMLGSSDTACWVTSDFGVMWSRLYEGQPTQCQWGLQSRDNSSETASSERVFLIDDGYLLYLNKVGDEVHDTGLADVDEIFFVGDYLYATSITKDENQLWVSKNPLSGTTVTFSRVTFPDQQMDFSFFGDPSGGIWIASKITSTSGVLYTSGYEGTVFTFALANVNRENGNFDFQNVGGIGGIYVVNQYVNRQLKTQITFNNGGEWQHLAAPLTDYSGKRYNCYGVEGCGLHLFMNSADFSPIVTSDSAAGLIIASGNVGLQLDTSFARTYVSRDAGFTWIEVLDISTAYAIGNHGGLVTFIDNSDSTNYYWYSWNQGKTMTKVTFTSNKNALKMKTIMSDANSLRPSFAITTKSSLFTIDFSGLLPQNCTEDDFEPWTPSDGDATHGHCILGLETTYSRMIGNRTCVNQNLHDRVIATRLCPCQMIDYECDYEFTSLGYNKTNILECSWNNTEIQSPAELPSNCTRGVTYTLSRGYKFVAGDRCELENGLNLLPQSIVCEREDTSSTSSSSTSADPSSSSTSSSTGETSSSSSTGESEASSSSSSTSSTTSIGPADSTTSITNLITALSSSSSTTATAMTTSHYTPASESSDEHQDLAVLIGVPLGIFGAILLTVVFVAGMLGKLPRLSFMNRRRDNLKYSNEALLLEPTV